MCKNIFFEIHGGNLREGPGSFETTKRAFSYIKDLPLEPTILDIGCGPGQQSLDLAKLTSGKIFSVDNHQPFLDSLSQKVALEDLVDRITILKKDMYNLDFKPKSFDLIWSEGAIYIIGFQRGLKEWKPLLKQNGYMAISHITWLKENQPKELKTFWSEAYPEMTSIKKNIDIIENCGYKFLNYFKLPESDWWNYYNPIISKIENLKKKYKNKEAMETINIELKEMELYKNYSDYYGYIFYIFKNV